MSRQRGLQRAVHVPLSAAGYLLVAALTLAIAGCGDPNDTTVVVGVTPTPDGGARTATPLRTATVAAPTPTPIATAVGPTATSGGATATVVAATPTTSATAGTPGPTATPGPVDADVQRIADDIVPFLANTALLTGGSIAASSVDAATKTDDCPDGGTRIDDEKFPTRRLTFGACGVADALGSFQFDGTVAITLGGFDGGSIVFDFTLTDRATSHAVSFAGTLALTVDNDGFVLDGPLAVVTPEGDFTLHADAVTINANRKIIDGAGSVTDDGDNFGLATVAFEVVRRGAASNLTVTFDDQRVQTFTLDLETGELAPTS